MATCTSPQGIICRRCPARVIRTCRPPFNIPHLPYCNTYRQVKFYLPMLQPLHIFMSPISHYISNSTEALALQPTNFPPALYVGPYIALPITLIASLFCPPFRGRGIAFSALISLVVWATTVSPWPPNDGPLRPLRYGLACSWTFVLPVLEKLLVLVPERDCRRLDDKEAPSPPELSWSKLRWALALFATPRGVGWTHGSTRPNKFREEMRRQRISRPRFVFEKLLRSLSCYVALDAIMIAARKAEFQDSWAWDAVAIWKVIYGDALMAATVYVTMTMQFEIAAVIGVSFYLSRPEDWPPLFGDITTCYTVANVWGKFWHGYIRQPVLGFSHFITRKLNIPQRSLLAYSVHLTTAFSMSAFFHSLSLSVICPGYLAVNDLVTYMAVFFMSQPVATLVETVVIRFYRSLALPPDNSEPEQAIPRSDIRSSFIFRLLCQIFGRIIGYTWVLSWFTFTSWWFSRPYIVLGVMRWKLPFSFVEKMLFPSNS